MADKEGITLLLENEPACNGGFAEEVARLTEAVGHPRLRVLWDPGNEAYGGRSAYPEGYNEVSRVLGHVHLKDAYLQGDGTPKCVPIGQGAVPMAEQIRALEANGYTGLYTIETHYIPEGGTAMEGTALTLEGLADVLGAGSVKP
ncbi:sugar phosphate isomerase/epimerase [Paenibacillus sp. CC-CFT747]|nr:sugar phosphate isomerase/epimerase [Paenibacillus sp. CC-CFT747]